ncbi:MAG: 30S ribosomal protein S6 [Clostridia bacterium]|nr:30S ribosomal protein S6 [Clostridia bacterium]MBR2327673.1 30S ribosomal protein S6 [Clostridia bacterium]
MEKVIRSYELVYIIDAALTEEAIADTVKKFADLIAANGTVEKTEEWGKRKLAYEINKKTEGYYVFVCFKSEPEFPAELDRIFGITDGILRSMIINPEE